MTQDINHWRLEISSSLAQALWSIAFDDDDIACDLGETFLINGITRYVSEMTETYRNERLARVARYLGEARAVALECQEDLAKRLASYAKNEPPF